MNQLVRYIIIGVIVAVVAFLLWYFSSIVTYILISAVLSLMGKPIVDGLCRIKIKGWGIPRSLGAAVALIAIWMFFIAFFRIMIPLVVNQFNELGTVDVNAMVDSFSQPIDKLQLLIQKYLPASAQNFSLKIFITSKITTFFSVSMITSFFSSTANLMVDLFIALFAISFITYFFLKDDSLFYEGITILFPEKFEKQIDHALSSINILLRRYFIGLMLESIAIMILDTIGLSLIGINFQTAIVIGLISAILNVIPYIGPLVGAIIGVLIGLTTNINLMDSSQLFHLAFLILLAFLIIKLIDDIVLQPIIYGNSIKAHPLEIFLVLLIAGSIAGILGMLLAIPSYTVLRVFAKEFFNNFRVVQKLTEKI